MIAIQCELGVRAVEHRFVPKYKTSI